MAKQKLTREEKDRIAVLEYRARKVQEFRQQLDRERSKTVYSEKLAWSDSLTEEQRRIVWQLGEQISDFERLTTDLRKAMNHLRDEMTDGLKRMDEGNRPNFGTWMVGTRGTEVDQLVVEREATAKGIRRIAYVTNYFVPQIYSERELQQRERRLSIVVGPIASVPLGTDAGAFMAAVGGVALSDDTGTTRRYDSEDAAWAAAMVAVGEYVSF